ncbi:MAG: N-acetylmuramoyl-L-alanine amidase [Planctomycetota bacterium]|nr:MAG: N-acetylmuramoyl-L-alanine amidase [Planctomycetota bacterium]
MIYFSPFPLLRKKNILKSLFLGGTFCLSLMILIPPFSFCQEKPPCAFVPARYYTPMRSRPIRYVVIHTVEGSYQGCIRWFQSPKSKVSAHYVVSLDGDITQMVKDKDKAWHAGSSKYNLEAIGIEHEGWAHKNTWTDAQYRASARLTRYLCLRYSIPMDRSHIISHAQIAPKRRSDPGPYFDWDYYIRLVRGENAVRPLTPEKAEERERAFEEAEKAMNSGNYIEAYKKYRNIANNYPESELSQKAKKKLEEFKKKRDLLLKLLEELEKEDQEEAFKMAKELLEKGRKKEAEFLAKKLEATYPGSQYLKEFQKLLASLEKKVEEGEKKGLDKKEELTKEGKKESAVKKLKELEKNLEKPE